MFKTRITRTEKSIATLHEERTDHFHDEDTRTYDTINRKLNRLRKALDEYHALQTLVRTYGVCPVVDRNYGKTRYETLPEEMRKEIVRHQSGSGLYTYQAKNGPIGRNLKDVVVFVANK